MKVINAKKSGSGAVILIMECQGSRFSVFFDRFEFDGSDVWLYRNDHIVASFDALVFDKIKDKISEVIKNENLFFK